MSNPILPPLPSLDLTPTQRRDILRLWNSRRRPTSARISNVTGIHISSVRSFLRTSTWRNLDTTSPGMKS